MEICEKSSGSNTYQYFFFIRVMFTNHASFRNKICLWNILSSFRDSQGAPPPYRVRKLSSTGMTAWSRRPRDVTVRDNFQSRSPSAKCCELYASLHDRFRLEVRILFYPMRTLKLAAWVTLMIAGMPRWAGRGREYRWRETRRSGAQPRWGPGAKPRRGTGGRSPATVTKRT